MKIRPWQTTWTILMVGGWLLPSVYFLVSAPWVGVPATLAGGVLVFARIRMEWAAERRQERWYRGRCTRCGYDMRASPARCPECGATPADL